MTIEQAEARFIELKGGLSVDLSINIELRLQRHLRHIGCTEIKTLPAYTTFIYNKKMYKCIWETRRSGFVLKLARPDNVGWINVTSFSSLMRQLRCYNKEMGDVLGDSTYAVARPFLTEFMTRIAKLLTGLSWPIQLYVSGDSMFIQNLQGRLIGFLRTDISGRIYFSDLQLPAKKITRPRLFAKLHQKLKLK